MSQNKKAVFLDLDGTLCTCDDGPSRLVMGGMRMARERGHKLFLNTGRTQGTIPPKVLELAWDGFITAIGACIEIDGKVLQDSPYPADEAERLVELLRQAGMVFLAEAGDATFTDLRQFRRMKEKLTPGCGINHEVAALFALPEQERVREWSERSGQPIYKVAFLSAENRQLERLRPRLEERYSVVVHPPERPDFVTDIELVRPDVNKGIALLRVCQACGINPQDSIAIGDSANDCEMLRCAGLSVAMANGDPQIRSIADIVCPSVEEDGVYYIFKELGLLSEGE